MRKMAGILCLLLGLIGGYGEGISNQKTQETENMQRHMEPEPDFPQALWNHVRKEVGFLKDPLGVDARFHRDILNPDHVIPALLDVFGDIRTVPILIHRLSDLLLSSPEDAVRAVHLAYRMLGASAGGFGPPLPGADPKREPLNDSEEADRLLRKILKKRDESGMMGEISPASEKAWRELPLSVKRLVLSVLTAVAEARPYLDEAFKRGFGGKEYLKREGVSDTQWLLYEDFRKAWAESGEIYDRSVFDAVDRIDLDYMSCASRILLEEIQRGIEDYGLGRQEIGLDFKSLTFDTAYGKFAVFGRNDDRIDKEYAFIIDLGGDDSYTERNAAPRSLSRPISIIIDCGGDDEYESQGEAVSLGCGCFGIGAVFDLGGNDRYVSGESGLGSAFFGTGLVMDVSGDDRYIGKGRWTQGAAHVGVGMLIDLSGNDAYYCVGASQGFGSTSGVGMLLDYSGNDAYHARLSEELSSQSHGGMHSFAQGSGSGRWADATDGHSLAGGYGILLEAEGNDLYDGGDFCQGAGYWWGFGSLLDRGGDDIYRSESYALGAAAHSGIGCLHDLKGNDSYNNDNQDKVRTQLQGYARDGSLGIFIDEVGDDLYVHRNRCAGSADLNSVALFWDRKGNDSYQCLREGPYGLDLSYGDAPPPIGVGEGESQMFHPFGMRSVGVFLDTGGEDVYEEIKPGNPPAGFRALRFGNDREWKHQDGPFRFGFGLDKKIP